jgi:hypothetical protein
MEAGGRRGVTYGRDPLVHHRVSRMDRAGSRFIPLPEGAQNMVNPRDSRMAIEPILVFCFLIEKAEQIPAVRQGGGSGNIFDCKSEGRIVPTTVTRNGAGAPTFQSD